MSDFGEEIDDPKSDFWREEFGRSQTFDLGHRDGLFEMLVALRDQAQRQFVRSGCTAEKPFGTEHDMQDHSWDAQVYYTLLTLIDARYKPANKRIRLPRQPG